MTSFSARLQSRAASPLDEMERTLDYRDIDEAAHPDFRSFLSRWEEARGDRPLPSRGDIDPKAFRGYLKRIHLYDVIDGGENFRCRIAGDAVYVSYDVDLRGKLVTEHPHPAIRNRLLIMLRRTAASARPVYVVSMAAPRASTRHPRIENLWLPLGSGRKVEHIVAQTIYS